MGLPVTGRSLPQLLKNAGYATALVGKWHLGWKPEFSPIRHGVTGRAQQAVRSGKWKLVMDGQRAMLFDLDGDVSERTNLIAGHTDLAKRLRTQLAAWQADVDAEAKQRAARTRLPDS